MKLVLLIACVILVGSVIAVVLFASDRQEFEADELVIPTPLPRPTSPVDPTEYPPLS